MLETGERHGGGCGKLTRVGCKVRLVSGDQPQFASPSSIEEVAAEWGKTVYLDGSLVPCQ